MRRGVVQIGLYEGKSAGRGGGSVDGLTTLGAGLAVLGSKELMTKLLGPTAEYIGGELKNLVERCNANLNNVFRIALKKLGDRANESGAVSPRILKHVVDEGRFCEDPVMAEYLGGVLASSKSEVSRDDRGVTFLNLIGTLSSYQLRTHCLIYTAMVRRGSPVHQDTSNWYESDSITLLVPESAYIAAMEYGDDESHDDIAHHAFLGLETKGLSERGTAAVYPPKGHEIEEPFRFVWPTRYGFELFLWGLGLGRKKAESFFDLPTDMPLPIECEIKPLGIRLGKVSFK